MYIYVAIRNVHSNSIGVFLYRKLIFAPTVTASVYLSDAYDVRSNNSYLTYRIYEPSYVNTSCNVSYFRSSLRALNPVGFDVNFDLEFPIGSPPISSGSLGLQRGAPWPMARRNSVRNGFQKY